VACGGGRLRERLRCPAACATHARIMVSLVTLMSRGFHGVEPNVPSLVIYHLGEDVKAAARSVHGAIVAAFVEAICAGTRETDEIRVMLMYGI
jgi:hypothetical protein